MAWVPLPECKGQMKKVLNGGIPEKGRSSGDRACPRLQLELISGAGASTAHALGSGPTPAAQGSPGASGRSQHSSAAAAPFQQVAPGQGVDSSPEELGRAPGPELRCGNLGEDVRKTWVPAP